MKKVRLIETRNLKYFEEGFLGAEGKIEFINNTFYFYFSVQSINGFCMSSRYRKIEENEGIITIQVICGGGAGAVQYGGYTSNGGNGGAGLVIIYY